LGFGGAWAQLLWLGNLKSVNLGANPEGDSLMPTRIQPNRPYYPRYYLPRRAPQSTGGGGGAKGGAKGAFGGGVDTSSYLDTIYGAERLNDPIRSNGIANRYRNDLLQLGRYKLFQANNFDVSLTRQVDKYEKCKSRDIYYKARKTVESLFPKRWTMFESFLITLVHQFPDK
jgi:hypothetical protein